MSRRSDENSLPHRVRAEAESEAQLVEGYKASEADDKSAECQHLTKAEPNKTKLGAYRCVSNRANRDFQTSFYVSSGSRRQQRGITPRQATGMRLAETAYHRHSHKHISLCMIGSLVHRLTISTANGKTSFLPRKLCERPINPLRRVGIQMSPRQLAGKNTTNALDLNFISPQDIRVSMSLAQTNEYLTQRSALNVPFVA